MNRISILIWTLILMGSAAMASIPGYPLNPINRDSIVITIGNKTKLVILGENQKELEKLLQYDLNALLMDLKIRLDSSKTDGSIIVEDFNGSQYLKESDGKGGDYVRVDINGVHIKSDRGAVAVESEEEEEKENGDWTDHMNKGRHFYKKVKGSSPRKGFDISLGFNTYSKNELTPGYTKSDYALRPFGSRYVKLGYIASGQLVKSEKVGLFLDLGADFSWNNLMFESDKTIIKGDDQVRYQSVIDQNGAAVELKKSKQVLPYLNVSLMPTLSFSNTLVSYVSAGVYGGYRLGGYTKVRQEGTKDVDKVRADYFVNDLRYGISAEVGIRNFLNLFVQYDINDVFKADHGPAVRMINFGIKL
ncbi:outer membrane beta-barrel protein [Dyadobacter tibetensis]|uniref:outer membrane beta-barrel protein n=1 Tax=Dyadobacter tibetensis TaxID=1211851 RepID=UPI000472915D|nr:outer membrane beta-barrel protein [Dyadobacter tibetensis]